MVMVVRDGSTVPAIGTQGVPLTPLHYNNNDIAVQTPPVVSQGAVAYGIISAPFYAFPNGIGFNPGRPDQQHPGAAALYLHVSQCRSAHRASEDDRPGFRIRYRGLAALGQP